MPSSTTTTTRGASTVTTITKLPLIINDLRNVLRSLDWERLRDDVRLEAAAKLAIVGPVNAGKSTLFNLIEGHNSAETGPVPGTTKVPMHRVLGPFVLVDTPGFGEVGGVDRAHLAAHSAS